MRSHVRLRHSNNLHLGGLRVNPLLPTELRYKDSAPWGSALFAPKTLRLGGLSQLSALDPESHMQFTAVSSSPQRFNLITGRDANREQFWISQVLRKPPNTCSKRCR